MDAAKTATRFSPMRLFQNYSLDLGTANTLISDLEGEIVLHEPTAIALSSETDQVVALGNAAEQLMGRSTDSVIVNRPLEDGVIFSQEAAGTMLSHFVLQVSGGWNLFLPRVIAGIPSGASDVERRALEEAIADAGAKLQYLISEPVAAAIGAGLPVTEPISSMVLDIGGGTSEVAILSMAGVVFSRSIKIAGNELTEAIQRYVKQKYRMKIGFFLAEKIKHSIGSVHPQGGVDDAEMEVAGVDMTSSLPTQIILKGAEIREVLSEPIESVLIIVRQSIEDLQPELAADLAHSGITLVGGGALLKGLDYVIQEAFDIKVNIPPEPLHCVTLGAGKAMADPQKYSCFLRSVG